MEQLSEQQIRRSVVNCSRGEATSMALPRNLNDLDWESVEFLGWRDLKAPLRSYIVTWRNGSPTGVALRAPESTRSGAVAGLCSLCRSSRPANAISLFVARRTGRSGRDGNTVGTYICADLACSQNVRVEKATLALRPAPGLTVEQRISALRERVDAFIDEVLRPEMAARQG